MAYNMKGFSGFGSPLKKRGPKEVVEEHKSRVSKKSTKIKSTKIAKNKPSKSKVSTSKTSTKSNRDTKTTPKISKKTSFTKPSIDQTFLPTSAASTIKERFDTAFASAKSAGKKTFEFEGKMYTTKIK